MYEGSLYTLVYAFMLYLILGIVSYFDIHTLIIVPFQTSLFIIKTEQGRTGIENNRILRPIVFNALSVSDMSSGE